MMMQRYGVDGEIASFFSFFFAVHHIFFLRGYKHRHTIDGDGDKFGSSAKDAAVAVAFTAFFFVLK